MIAWSGRVSHSTGADVPQTFLNCIAKVRGLLASNIPQKARRFLINFIGFARKMASSKKAKKEV